MISVLSVVLLMMSILWGIVFSIGVRFLLVNVNLLKISVIRIMRLIIGNM